VSTSPLLVLWDIDHTLIETRGVGGEVFRAAFAEVTGFALAQVPNPTGLTELEIFTRALAARGVTGRDGLFEEFAEAQVRGYRERADDLAGRGRPLPGAREILERVAGLSQPGLVQSVLSGNTVAAGRAKLEAFGLDGYIDWDVAAGGDDAAYRPDLVPVAWRRGQAKHGWWYMPSETVLIGDTRADIATAHANRCRVVAVATGNTSFSDLSYEWADVVLHDLSDTDAVLEALLST